MNIPGVWEYKTLSQSFWEPRLLSAASRQPCPTAWRAVWLLFDLVCFGLLIKHGLCFVGGASQSGALQLTPPPLFIPSTGVQAAQSRSKASQASPGTHTQLEAQSQGDFKTAGRN